MSLLATTNNGKTFQKPEGGIYHGVLADIADLGEVTTAYQGKVKTQEKVRFVWILNVNDKDGAPLSVTQSLGKNLHEKSKLYKSVKQILNAAPPLELDLERLVGQTRQLLITRTTTGNPGTEGFTDYANVDGIAPAQPGIVVAIPLDFVRDKNKPLAEQAKTKQQAKRGGQAQQPAQQAQRPAQFQQLPVFGQPPAGQPDIAF
jgi:hypothetical protein